VDEQPRHAKTNRLLTVPEAAAALGCRRSLLYRLLSTGDLQSLQVGRLRRVPSQAVEDFISRKLSEGADAAAGQSPPLRRET
jgi:excisionase family DNA binding protein